MSTMQRINAQSHRDPDALERDIEATRHDLAHTLDLLEQRLSPSQLVDRALHVGREQGGEFARNLGSTVKYHPIPLLLTAVGIGWLALADSRPPPATPYGPSGEDGHLADKARHLKDSAREKASQLSGGVHAASGRVRETADALRTRAAETGDALRHQRERARDGFERTLQEQPLVLGALGMALGALLGGVLPRTPYEDRAVGEYGERLRARAADAAHDVQSSAARIAEGAREGAAETSADPMREVPPV